MLDSDRVRDREERYHRLRWLPAYGLVMIMHASRTRLSPVILGVETPAL